MGAELELPAYLNSEVLRAILQRALREDLGSGDLTSEAIIAPDAEGEAEFVTREPGVAAGLHAAEQVFRLANSDLVVVWQQNDGDTFERSSTFGHVRGNLRAILAAERLALNLLQRMSGIATLTAQMVAEVQDYPARIRDTRKTAPGLRLLDKWAVLLGGGTNHRLGLYDRILIKDNHIDVAGGLCIAVERAAAAYPGIPVDVEARTLDEVTDALEVADFVEVLLLDNMAQSAGAGGQMDTSTLQAAVDLVGGRMQTEASGNVTLRTVRAIAATGVDYISSGALTHSARALDVALHIGGR